MINHKFGLEKSFQETLYRINNWTNESSGWIVELIKSQYRPNNQVIDHYQEVLT